MTNVRDFNAQHPNNEGAIVQTIKKKSSSPKEARSVAWQQIKWPIEPPKDFAPSNFSNETMVWVSNSM